MKYGKHGLWHNFISSKVVLFLVIILFLFLIKVSWNMRERSIISLAKLDEAKDELIKLNNRQDDLKNQIDNLSTEQGIEGEIRTKYKAVKEGEFVAVIVDSDQVASASEFASSSMLSTEKSVGWWNKVLRVFGF